MHYETLKTLAVPFLLAIKDKMAETYGLSVLDKKRLKNLIVYSIRGPDYTCFSFADKTATPLHTSAPGKALVAFLPEKQRAALIGRLTFERLTPNTITDRASFEARLAHIRRAGYATDIAEEISCCHCGGVPIFDPGGHPVGALWLSGVAKRLGPGPLRAGIRVLQGAAKQIEAEVAKLGAGKKAPSASSPYVAAALGALSKRLAEDVDYEALARSLHTSYSTLRTAFRRETGTTLGQHHLSLRIREVQRLLTQTSLSITEIAARLNFYDQKHLSSIFRKKVGLTPLAFRKRAPAEP